MEKAINYILPGGSGGTSGNSGQTGIIQQVVLPNGTGISCISGSGGAGGKDGGVGGKGGSVIITYTK